MRRFQYGFSRGYSVMGMLNGMLQLRSTSDVRQKHGEKLAGISMDSNKPITSGKMPSSTLCGVQCEEDHTAKTLDSDKASRPVYTTRKTTLTEKEVPDEMHSALDGHKKSNITNTKTTNPFLDKLSQMEKSSAAYNTEGINKSESRKQIHEKRILEERKNMLLFRDVGMDLDKPILSRDVFLVFKYFRYGIEFAVDNELERMLRYFNEHALNELKIIQNSKLMRGPSLLHRRRGRGKNAICPFQVITSFPSLSGANMRQYCSFSQDSEQRAISLLGSGGTRAFCEPFIKAKEGTLSSSSRAFDEKDSSQTVLLTPASFRRPAVLIYSQLGQKLGAQADVEWRRLAYASILPSMLNFIPKVNKAESHVESQLENHIGGLRKRSLGSAGIGSMPIDVLSLRSMDIYKYRWVHRLYVRRFARSLMQSTEASESPGDAHVRGLLTASSTFVGCKLLQPFYSVLGLRNYLSPYVMLVDHEGVIRWLSSGCPDEYEREHFPLLLKQLQNEYLQAVGR